MAWSIFIAFLSFASILQAQDSLLEQQSREQVRRYIENVQQNNNTAINLWALAEASRDKPEIQRFIKETLKQQAENQPALQVFRDTTLSYAGKLRQLSFTAELPILLVAYLLTEQNDKNRQNAVQHYTNSIGFSSSGDVQYPLLIDAIMQQKPITTDILPARYFHPLHFFLFYNKPVMQANTFSSEYLDNAAKEWSFTNETSLQQILGITALYHIFYTQYEYNKTERFYRPIIDSTLFPNSTRKLNILRALDYSMYRLGYYNRSLNIIRDHSLPLARYFNQPETELKLQVSQGAYLYRIGKIEQSEQIYIDVREQLDTANYQSVSKARVLNNLAINYWKSGEFDRYLDLQFKALETVEKEKTYALQFDILKNLSTHYRVGKNFNSAYHYLAKAKQIAKDQEDRSNMARVSYLEGQLYQDTKSDYDLAIASFDTALSFITIDNDYRSYQNILIEKAHSFEQKSAHKHAKKIYVQIQKNAIQRDDNSNIIFASFSKANTYLSLGQVDSARIMMDTLNTQSLDALDFYQLVKVKTVQARYQEQIGQPEEGIDLLRPVIDQIVNRSRGSGDLETGFWQVEPEYLNAFDKFANLLINAGQTEKAVEALDRLKTINDAALYQNPLVRSKVLDEQELSLYKRLTEDLDALRKQLLTAGEEKRAQFQQQIDEKSARKSALDRKITANAGQEPMTVNEIQQQMDAYQRVLHITELNDIFYLATISRTGVEFKKIPITQKIRNHFEQTIAQVAAGTTDLTNLYPITELMGVNQLPDYVEKLTIIPDSYLYQVPLDILPLEEPEHAKSYGNAVYLIERYRTNYMTSLRDFNKPVSNSESTYDYAGFGVSRFDDDRTALVPLPQAKTEIQQISNRLTAFNAKKTYLNKEATEQTFRNTAPQTRILHLATHSEVSGRDPMFSSIYLSRAEQDNERKFPGRIFAYELFELNLQNDLIMLNSCESGSGSYLQGTGVVGISRALRYAGAQALVLNLWSVNDMMASEFAVKFYEGINEGQSKSEALRNAKLHFLKTKNANPHYWGSYMLLGNEEAIVQPNRTANNIVAASFMIFFFSMAIASSALEIWRRRNRTNGRR